MNWIAFAIAGAVIVALFALKWRSFVSPEIARKQLAAGALVIDVRTTREFADAHVPGAINIPLGELRARLPRDVPDKNRPLLFHCLSGGRSAVAARQAVTLGYTNVFNLGSLGRAKNIATSK